MELQNTDVETRVWPSLQTTDGRTLELPPGGIADVAVDVAPRDRFLRPVGSQESVGRGSARGKASKAASGPENAPEKASGENEPLNEPTTRPAEADASGKEE